MLNKDVMLSALQEKLQLNPLTKDVVINVQTIHKSSGLYNGLCLREKNRNIGIVLNLDMFCKNFNSIDDAVQKIFSTYISSIDNMPAIDAGSIIDYEKIKNSLIVELVNTAAHKDFLSQVPHKEIEDLSIVYRVIFQRDEQIELSMSVTNEMLKLMQISPDRLHDDALKSAANINPVELFLFGGIMPTITSKNFLYGAATIVYSDVLKKASKIYGNYYILPSSVHELVIIPECLDLDLGYIKSNVEQVNQTILCPEDFLSNNIYHYDHVTDKFEIAENYLARISEPLNN